MGDAGVPREVARCSRCYRRAVPLFWPAYGRRFRSGARSLVSCGGIGFAWRQTAEARTCGRQSLRARPKSWRARGAVWFVARGCAGWVVALFAPSSLPAWPCGFGGVAFAVARPQGREPRPWRSCVSLGTCWNYETGTNTSFNTHIQYHHTIVTLLLISPSPLSSPLSFSSSPSQNTHHHYHT